MGRESLVPWIAFLLLGYVISNKVISLLWENNISLGWLWIFFFFLALWCLWKHWLTLRCYAHVQDYPHYYHPCVRSHLKQDQAEACGDRWLMLHSAHWRSLAEEAKCLPWGERRKLQQESISRSRTSAYLLSTQSDFFFFQACSFELGFCVSFHLPFQV